MSEIFAPGTIAGPPATFMGPHNLSTSYAIGTAVSSDGSSYVSLVNSNMGNTPASSPTEWGLLAAGGTNGTNGATGAAGSASAVSALAGAIMPGFVGQNLFDLSKITPATQVNSADGALSAQGATNASALLYCPGATSMVSNLPISAAFGTSGVCLYDANGSFICALPAANFSSLSNGAAVNGGSAFPLPGNQVYVRICYIVPWLTWGGYPGVDTVGMIYAAITGTATLPGTYQTAGFDSTGDVNAKVAVVAASIATSVMSAVVASLPTVFPLNANRFDPNAAQVGFMTNTDGTVTGGQNFGGGGIPQVSGLIYCPGATTLVANLAFYQDGFNGLDTCIQLFDSNKHFIGVATNPVTAGYGGSFTPFTFLTGTQTYVRFCYNAGSGSAQGSLPACGMVFAGTSTSIASLTSTTRFTPFFTTYAPVNPYQGVNVKKATDLGAPNDASADCTAVLNAFLATASSTNPVKLILNGVFMTSGLVISPNGYTTIEGIGWGSGLSTVGGPYSIVIGAGVYGAYNVAPPARTATNIIIRDFSVVTTNGSMVSMLLTSCSNVIAENLYFPAAGSSDDFMLTFGNANRIYVRGCSFTSTGTTHDGVHLDGLCEDVMISDCYFATGDDAIALNAPEGYGGNISRVTVTNCIFDGSLTVMRIYTSIDITHMPSNNVHKVRNVVISNCAGWTASNTFTLGISGGGYSSAPDVDQIHDFSVSNCTFASPLGLTTITVPMGAWSLRGVKFIPFDQLVFPNLPGTAPVIGMWSYPVGELLLDDFTILRNPDGNSTPVALISTNGGSSIGRLTLRNIRVLDEAGTNYGAVPAVLDLSGTVALLRVDELDMTQFTAIVSAAGWTNVTATRGAGLIEAAVQVPDSVMDNNALYLSSTAGGAPSIKVGGTAKRLTLV